MIGLVAVDVCDVDLCWIQLGEKRFDSGGGFRERGRILCRWFLVRACFRTLGGHGNVWSPRELNGRVG